jgi:hypothetical protein
MAESTPGFVAVGIADAGLYSSVFFSTDLRLITSAGVAVVKAGAGFAKLMVVGRTSPVKTAWRVDSSTCIHGLSTRR